MIKKEKRKLKWNMIRLLILGWIIPMVLITSVMFILLDIRSEQYIERKAALSTEKAAELIKQNLNIALSDSRGASYMSMIEEGYNEYLQNQDSYKLYTTVTRFLSDQYRFNAYFHTAMLVFNEYPKRVYYTKNDMELKHAYDKVKNFEVEAKDILLAQAKNLGTNTFVTNIDDQVYLVRNMLTRDFKPFALLVMELNPTNLFKNIESVLGYRNYCVYINDDYLYGNGQKISPSQFKSDGKITKVAGETYIKQSIKADGQRYDIITRLDLSEYKQEETSIFYLLGVVLLFLLPLFLLVFRFFRREINQPIDELTLAAKQIEEGNLGYKMEEINSSKEMGYLSESFNHMSLELKRQFDMIYSEEIALRDAKIKALQSQINPHFLNNTLEIINWEARMNGDYKVSTMIEALSTMLEATLNRNKKEMVYLAEELSYMNAYLFIAEKRHGKKLKVEREIDEELLGVLVPRLIIQPIVENAVEHGRGKDNNIHIKIQIVKEGSYLLIRIMNHAKLAEEDRKKIENLLSEQPEIPTGAMNIGIRNVNLRLKILYGKECGLTIISNQKNQTISTLKLKWESEQE
ncbi:MAG TPA: histidine kinase [Candidatus Dorea intestinavium]|nr:histidine kinase [Candidatus Dorea intestinavium]